MVKYLFYNAKARWGEGLSDRRACLMILLAEAKLSNRTAVIPEFSLGSKHNNGKKKDSYIVDEYCNVDSLKVDYILKKNFDNLENEIDKEDILEINDNPFDYNRNEVLVVRNLVDDNFWNLNKLSDVISLAKLYHGNGAKFVVPMIAAPKQVIEIADKVIAQLPKPTVGLHLRRTDRLNKKLDLSMNEKVIISKMNGFDYNSVFYCTNDKSYKINHEKFYSNKNFDFLEELKTDNFLFFCVEMYIVDNCDISIRTFKDSSPFFYMEDKTNKNYSICDYGMHMSFSQNKKIPDSFVKCNYETTNDIDGKPFFDKRVNFVTKLNSLFLRAKASILFRIKN